MKALVTGGAGFIGSHLVEALLKAGGSVVALDNLSGGSLENLVSVIGEPRFRLVQGSVADPQLVDSVVRDCDVVFHLAAVLGVERIVREPLAMIEVNVLGTHNVFIAASRYGKKMVVASSSEVYGKSERVPFRESDDTVMGPTTTTRWSYAASKAVDEFLGLAFHRERGLPVVIFRLFNTVGPRQRAQYGMVLPRFVQQALGGRPLTVYGDGRQTRCFVDVEDAVGAIVSLAECPEAVGQVFNIGSTEEISIRDLASKVIRAVRGTEPVEGQIVVLPYEAVYGDGYEDTRRRIPDISKIRAIIGWEPHVSLEQTIRRVAGALGEEEARTQS